MGFGGMRKQVVLCERDRLEMNMDFQDNSNYTDIPFFLSKVAHLPVDIVIEGETVTGKDTLAQKIHKSSMRSGRFVAVNCAALPEGIAESELFGVKAGAYTGATSSRAGLIEASNKGTLYLDEIDSMSLVLQAKLLRVLEERGVTCLGSTVLKPVDLRIIPSTKYPLIKLVEKGLFRLDLLYRLSTTSISLPCLRQKRSDISPLFEKFVIEFANKINVIPPSIDNSIRKKIEKYNWPGNIRELKFSAARYVIGLPTLNIHREYTHIAPDKKLKSQLLVLEKKIIKESLIFNSGVLDDVALELDIPKRTLYHKMNKLNIFNDYRDMKNIKTT
ncbi:sigma 54-interacting transcriptional regulator [bacterium]|nr:sigma 54-interacting transcriptional regulator [bacterium]